MSKNKQYPHCQYFDLAVAKMAPAVLPANLKRRQKDWALGSQAQKCDSQGSRWSSGGYHKPGSNKK